MDPDERNNELLGAPPNDASIPCAQCRYLRVLHGRDCQTERVCMRSRVFLDDRTRGCALGRLRRIPLRLKLFGFEETAYCAIGAAEELKANITELLERGDRDENELAQLIEDTIDELRGDSEELIG